MKKWTKILLLISAFALALGMLPAMQSPANAMNTPVISLVSISAPNPYVDLVLDGGTYCSGGPFTVSFEWMLEAHAIDTETANEDYYGYVTVVGTVFGSPQMEQADPNLRIQQNKTWMSASFSFQDVGSYQEGTSTKNGNLLRFALYDARGALHIRNLVIKNSAGAVVYDLNADAAILQIVSNMHANNVSSCDISELAAMDKWHWVAGQNGTGQYAADITYLDEAAMSGTTQNTSVSPPTNNNVRVICGSQQIYPASRMVSMVKYRNGEPYMHGDGAGFGNAPWDADQLKQVTLNGSIQIYVTDTKQVEQVDVMGESIDGKQKYNVSALNSLAPGSYTVEFWVTEWTKPVNGEQTCYQNQHAFTLIVPAASTVSTTTSTNPIYTTYKPPHTPSPFVVCGAQKVIPKARVFCMYGYKNGELNTRGEGEAFKYPSWDRHVLPQVILNDVLEVYETETLRIDRISVILDVVDNRLVTEVYDVSQLSTLAPGYYTIQFTAIEICGTNRFGEQMFWNRRYAFELVVLDSDGNTVPTTKKTTTTKQTTSVQTVNKTSTTKIRITSCGTTTIPTATCSRTTITPTTSRISTQTSSTTEQSSGANQVAAPKEEPMVFYWILTVVMTVTAVVMTAALVIKHRRR